MKYFGLKCKHLETGKNRQENPTRKVLVHLAQIILNKSTKNIELHGKKTDLKVCFTGISKRNTKRNDSALLSG